MQNNTTFAGDGWSIVCIVFPGVVALDLIGPLEAFSLAMRLPDPPVAPYDLHVVSPDGGLITATNGLQIQTAPLASVEAMAIDTLVIPGGRVRDDTPSLDRVISWIAERAPSVRRVCSVCTGAFLLGRAGLLDGRRATTHWAQTGRLSEDFPACDVQKGPIFVNDGHVWTSAGVTAGIDLALALIEEDHGHHVAMRVAETMVVYMRRTEGAPQISQSLEAQLRADSDFSKLAAWIASNLTEDLSVESLAEHCNMAPRTFARTFAATVGTTPARFVANLRLERARPLIEQGELSMKEIARQTGWANEQNLRRAVRLHADPH